MFVSLVAFSLGVQAVRCRTVAGVTPPTRRRRGKSSVPHQGASPSFRGDAPVERCVASAAGPARSRGGRAHRVSQRDVNFEFRRAGPRRRPRKLSCALAATAEHGPLHPHRRRRRRGSATPLAQCSGASRGPGGDAWPRRSRRAVRPVALATVAAPALSCPHAADKPLALGCVATRVRPAALITICEELCSSVVTRR